jgi:hypothetical protein
MRGLLPLESYFRHPADAESPLASWQSDELSANYPANAKFQLTIIFDGQLNFKVKNSLLRSL